MVVELHGLRRSARGPGRSNRLVSLSQLAWLSELVSLMAANLVPTIVAR